MLGAVGALWRRRRRDRMGVCVSATVAPAASCALCVRQRAADSALRQRRRAPPTDSRPRAHKGASSLPPFRRQTNSRRRRNKLTRTAGGKVLPVALLTATAEQWESHVAARRHWLRREGERERGGARRACVMSERQWNAAAAPEPRKGATKSASAELDSRRRPRRCQPTRVAVGGRKWAELVARRPAELPPPPPRSVWFT